jgi:hypothetical protein
MQSGAQTVRNQNLNDLTNSRDTNLEHGPKRNAITDSDSVPPKRIDLVSMNLSHRLPNCNDSPEDFPEWIHC